MQHSFVAYIDEAGDEGTVFNPDGTGSTRWFVLSALVVRKARDMEIVRLGQQIRTLLGKPPKYPLHFRNLKHEQRIPIVRLLGQAPVRLISVVVHKPSIPLNATEKSRGWLYRYASRLLLERVSWLCRDNRQANDGNGNVDLVFSNRSAMSYEDLRSYMERLKGSPISRIDWGVIDPQTIRAVNHDQLAGLQLADAVATGTYYGFNANAYRETEPRYLQLLATRLYQRDQTLLGYGLKLWCEDANENLVAEAFIQSLAP